jgi:hypothetical protein
MDEILAGPCGIFCGDCEYLGDSCAGCGHVEGKPFWTSEVEMEICPLFDCSVNVKRLEHCGLCDDLPCELFRSFSDPSLTPQEAERSVLERVDELKKRREMGTDAWLERKGS